MANNLGGFKLKQKNGDIILYLPPPKNDTVFLGFNHYILMEWDAAYVRNHKGILNRATY